MKAAITFSEMKTYLYHTVSLQIITVGNNATANWRQRLLSNIRRLQQCCSRQTIEDKWTIRYNTTAQHIHQLKTGMLKCHPMWKASCSILTNSR